MIEEPRILTDTIDMCIEHNILVFDAEATLSHITKKLIWYILKLRPSCMTLYAPKDVYVEFVPDTWTGFNESIKMFGVNIVFDDDMCVMKEYFENRGGHLAAYDEYLLLATVGLHSASKPNERNTILASC